MSRIIALALACSLSGLVFAQDLLPTYPRTARAREMASAAAGSVVRGTVSSVTWGDDGRAVSMSIRGKDVIVDLATFRMSDGKLPEPADRPGPRRNRPDRGRQFSVVYTPKGDKRAECKDRNVFISGPNGENAYPITKDGSVPNRIKNGVASWVYGEELDVREAMWFSPDGKYLAYYRFDESKVPDYYLALDQRKLQSSLDIEAYPKVGAPNPSVQIFVYSLLNGTTTRVQAEFGAGKTDDLAHYLYDVSWSPKGDELLFVRTNRKQNTREWCAANPQNGTCRIIHREVRPGSWVDNHPEVTWLGQDRFLIITERSGFRNLEQYDFQGKKLSTVTNLNAEVERVVKVDEKAGIVWYTARDGARPSLRQLHRVRLDGTDDVRLTDPNFSHTINLSARGDFFIDTAETTELPPVTTLRDRNGKEKLKLNESDLTKFKQIGLRPVERIEFTAADGATKCYGELSFPSDFDPGKSYPVLVSVYAGPDSAGGFERFQMPSNLAEHGYIIASFDGRGTQGRGKAFKDAVYGKLGIVEIDDQAAGVRSLANRSYIDLKRVGIFGTSYGGYASAMALLRYPDVFAAASCSSSVTDFRNYDSIYTERYMGLLGDNLAGYEAGSAMKYADQLKGRMMLFFGTADNNVHPSNTMQLIAALQRARKNFELQAGPDQGHSGLNMDRMLEFFYGALRP
ncbi:MAG: DPP IV N-terminal domain-containing protein [Armatimonadetes bacterium]|nr:DPP IV N-terminal domain-containing protein [Armatimonadota bacterium]